MRFIACDIFSFRLLYFNPPLYLCNVDFKMLKQFSIAFENADMEQNIIVGCVYLQILLFFRSYVRVHYPK